MNQRLSIKIIICFFAVLFICSVSFADTQIKKSKGQTIYVPVYSNVLSGNRALPFNLAAMLSIRNVDIHNTLKVTSIDYHDNDGKLLKKYIEKPMVLGPLASNHIFIKESDEAGGFGANFIVRWEVDKKINAPIIESVMIGTRSGQGISFKSKVK
jgi:hypothetical protein